MPEYPLFKSYPKGSHRMDIVIGPEITIRLFNCDDNGSNSWADDVDVSRLKKKQSLVKLPRCGWLSSLPLG